MTTTNRVQLDWAAASAAAKARRGALGLTQEQLVARMPPGSVNIETFRRFERHERMQYRPTTMAQISVALGWHADALIDIARGLPAPSQSERSEIADELSRLRDAISSVVAVIGPLESAVLKSEKADRARRRRRA